MTVTLEIIFGLIACVIGVLAFYFGRISSAKTDATIITGVKKDIEYLSRDVTYIRDNIDGIVKKLDDSIYRLEVKIEQKIAEHERTYHNVTNQNQN